jgi:hypothetical protein
MKSKDLLKQNSLYAAMLPQMLSYQSAYLGGLEFKRTVRKKRPSEDSNLYLDLIENTVAQPICRYIVDTINSVVFDPPVHRSLKFATPQGTAIAPDNIEWAQLMTLDADLRNRSLGGFMESVGDLTSIYGQCWIFVDMPQETEGNLGRPYVVALNPIAVWDWEYEIYGGRPIVKYIKVLENEDDDAYYFKCYHLGTEEYPSYWISYRVNKSDQEDAEAEMIAEGNYPEGMGIPAFMTYAKRDPRSIDYGISDIDGASDAQREIYKLECEAYTSVLFAKTIIRADKGVSVPAQAGAIVRATQGQIETIPVDTGDIEKTMKLQAEVLNQIEQLTGLGGLRTSRHNIASGVAIIEERKTLHNLARAKARLMEVAEEQLFTYAARFMGVRWAGEIVYSTDYDKRDTNYRLAVYREAIGLVPENDMVNALITKDIIAILAPSESQAQYEQAYIDTIEDPALKQLMTEENEKVLSRDLQSQIPTGEDYEGVDDGDYDEEGMTNGVTITDTGTSYTVQQAIAVQLLQGAGGTGR